MATASSVLAQTPEVSPEARRVAAPVTEAMRQALAVEAALPPPVSTRETLERLGRLDQAGRKALERIDFPALSLSVRLEVFQVVGQTLDPVDHANMERLTALIPADGWFTRSAYGSAASEAAMLILQHAGDLATRKALLPRLLPLAERGEIDGAAYAMLYDRTANWDGRLQRYGTQFNCVDGRAVPLPLEDPAAVEALRAALRIPHMPLI